jgi:hypothetical protein
MEMQATSGEYPLPLGIDFVKLFLDESQVTNWYVWKNPNGPFHILQVDFHMKTV